MSLEQQLRDALSATYRVEHELGGGGMSRVFVAEETALGRRVALKVLSGVGDDVSVDRFQREIQTVANLQHPHIVPLFSAGKAGSTVFYTMPLVEGESLRSRLSRQSRLGVREAVQVARDVAEALVYAHRRGVIHRDIKPDNVLLTDGHAVVTDFGVAKALSLSAGDGTLTSVGVAIGTPVYMAPEQVVADPDADHRLDLYALGCVLYEMLAGKPPVTGSTIREIMTAQVASTPDDVTRLRADVPAEVAAWLRRALSKSPEDRWPTADEALAELDACLAKLTGEGTAASTARTVRTLAPWIAAAVAAILLVAGVLLFPRYFGSSPVDRSRIAVMPFVPTDPSDTELARLGRDLVVTLTANLDNVGDLRMIDHLSILAQSSGRWNSEAAVLEAAAGLGAGSALVGSLLRSGNTVRLDYRLLPTSGEADPIATGTVTAPLGDEGIFTLTDSATWGMLEEILPARDEQVPSFELLHTRSIPALRAFLEGENHLLWNRWTDAEQAYARAIAEDSTFWFAHRRVVQAADWLFASARRARSDSIAWEHISEFPERERLLMEHDTFRVFADHMAALAEITRRFPDYWYGWFQYGDHILHDGVRQLQAPIDAMEAFDRALELNPRLLPVLDHTVVFLNDSARVHHAYDRLRDLYGTGWDSVPTDYGLAASVNYRPFLSRARNGRIEDPVRETFIAELSRSRAVPTLLHWAAAMPMFAYDPQAQIETIRRVDARGASAQTMAALRLWEGPAWAMRGAWDSALVSLDRLSAERQVIPIAAARFATGVMAYWTGAVDRDAAASRRQDLAQYGGPEGNVDANRMLAFLDGVFAHADQREDGIESARAVLRTLEGDESAAWLERALAAFQLDLRGQGPAAADSLLAIERQRGGGIVFDHAPTPFIRLAAGRLKADEGDAAAADSLLGYYESAYPSIVPQLILRQTASLAAFERARAWDRAGDANRAARFYREFLRMYDMPPPSHQQFIEEAASALARLSGGADASGIDGR